MRISPLQNYYVIKAEPVSTKLDELRERGYKIPEGSEATSNVGVVVSAHYQNNKIAKAGDRVLFKPYGNEDATVGDETFLLVPEENLVALFIEEDAPDGETVDAEKKE